VKWNIVSDSSCDLFDHEIMLENGGFSTVPFILRVEQKDYVDDLKLNVPEMLEAMEASSSACTSACPSPEAWARQFQKADHTIAITISSNLSGSYNSAMLAREMVLAEHPEKKIYVLDSKSTGPEMLLCIEHLVQWIKSELSFDAIIQKAERFLANCKTTFALSSFDNLVKNGRMSRFAGFVAKRLNMWGIGIASDEGTIAVKSKTRGPQRALAIILADMQERGFIGGDVSISHCCNATMAEKLRSSIIEKWENAKVRIQATRGLDSFYAEREGLIIAFVESGGI